MFISQFNHYSFGGKKNYSACSNEYCGGFLFIDESENERVSKESVVNPSKYRESDNDDEIN